METLIEWAPDIGAGGLLTLFFFLIFMGKLVPGKERDYWREAYFEVSRQLTKALETGETTRDVLNAVESAIEREDPK